MQNKKNPFANSNVKVPFFKPFISKSDHKVVDNALKSNILTNGSNLGNFEKNFSKFTNSKFAIGVSNATSALHLSLKALGIRKGDEVIVPDITFVATATSVLLSGATPVLADVDENLNLSIDSIKKSLTRKTKAIIPVHFAGKACEIKKIKKIANSNNLKLIEDCAHAIGTRVDNQHVGTFGDTGCFSFYPTKNITTLEGGMVITQSNEIFKKISSLRNHGITKTLFERYSKGYPWEYDVLEPGYNYRLDEIRAALGINQLKQLKKLNKLRRNAFKYYNQKLKNKKGIITPNIQNDKEHSCHLYILKITKEFGMSRNELFQKLQSLGIMTSVHYKPLHKFTLFKKTCKIYDSLKNSKFYYDQIISLPLFPSISTKEQNYVIKHILN
jgi:perosamine synthetase